MKVEFYRNMFDITQKHVSKAFVVKAYFTVFRQTRASGTLLLNVWATSQQLLHHWEAC